MYARATIGFTSDWLKKWPENFEPITEWSDAKPKQFANYFRHSIENRSITPGTWIEPEPLWGEASGECSPHYATPAHRSRSLNFSGFPLFTAYVMFICATIQNLNTINTKLSSNHDLLWHLKGMLTNGFYDIFEEDFRGQRVSMVHHWFPVTSIPTIQFYAAAAFPQSIDVGVDTGRPTPLVFKEVGVMWWGDEIIREWMSHILENLIMSGVEYISLGRLQIVCKTCNGQNSFKIHGEHAWNGRLSDVEFAVRTFWLHLDAVRKKTKHALFNAF